MKAKAYFLDHLRTSFSGPSSRFTLELGSLSIESGDVLALVGPNGAGKTTLLMILAFLLRPDEGTLQFFGEDPWANEDSTVNARREAVLLPHHPYLFRGTVLDNIAFGLKIRKVAEPEWGRRAADALALVELSGYETKSTSGLSAGQAQRVALARALALKPKTLLLDEPTANIEAGLALRIEAVIREVCRAAQTTVVFSTHNFSQASRLADDILYLSEGRRVHFSHENCFSGMAETDGRMSWIEPRPGARIVFAGARTGHVTCVINPASIRIIGGGGRQSEPGPNVFGGRIARLETTETNQALLRVGGDLTFRVTVPLEDLKALGISLSSPVLIRFAPEAVELIGPEARETVYDQL